MQTEELKLAASHTKSIHNSIAEMDDKAQEKWEEYKEREKDEQIRLKKYGHTSPGVLRVVKTFDFFSPLLHFTVKKVV